MSESPSEPHIYNRKQSVGEMLFNEKLNTNDFIPIKKLKSGGYGTVILVTHKDLQKLLAIKIIKKQDMVRKNCVNRIKLEA